MWFLDGIVGSVALVAHGWGFMLSRILGIVGLLSWGK